MNDFYIRINYRTHILYSNGWWYLDRNGSRICQTKTLINLVIKWIQDILKKSGGR